LRSHLINFFIYLQQYKKSQKEKPDFKFLMDSIYQTTLKAIYRFEQPRCNPPLMRLRDYAFSQALSCIKSFAGETLTVKGLAQQTGVSEKTLEKVFHQRMGIPPKEYIRTYRLNRVRQDLNMNFRPFTKIADIANKWGFWHMGQFAKDYKKMFGELPSETLKKQ